MLNPNVVPKKIEELDNLIPVQISPPLPTDKIDLNYCRSLSHASAFTIYSCNNNINIVNENTVNEENPVHPYDINMFDNISINNNNKDNNNNNSKANSEAIDNLNDEKKCEEIMCITLYFGETIQNEKKNGRHEHISRFKKEIRQ